MTKFEKNLLSSLRRILSNLGWKGDVEVVDGDVEVEFETYDFDHSLSQKKNREDWSTDGQKKVVEEEVTTEPRQYFSGGSRGKLIISGATWAVAEHSHRNNTGVARFVSRVLVWPAGLRNPAALVAAVASANRVDLGFRAARYDRKAAVGWLRGKFRAVEPCGDVGLRFVPRDAFVTASVLVTSTSRSEQYCAPDQDERILELVMRHGPALIDEAFPYDGAADSPEALAFKARIKTAPGAINMLKDKSMLDGARRVASSRGGVGILVLADGRIVDASGVHADLSGSADVLPDATEEDVEQAIREGIWAPPAADQVVRVTPGNWYSSARRYYWAERGGVIRRFDSHSEAETYAAA